MWRKLDELAKVKDISLIYPSPSFQPRHKPERVMLRIHLRTWAETRIIGKKFRSFPVSRGSAGRFWLTCVYAALDGHISLDPVYAKAKISGICTLRTCRNQGSCQNTIFIKKVFIQRDRESASWWLNFVHRHRPYDSLQALALITRGWLAKGHNVTFLVMCGRATRERQARAQTGGLWFCFFFKLGIFFITCEFHILAPVSIMHRIP